MANNFGMEQDIVNRKCVEATDIPLGSAYSCILLSNNKKVTDRSFDPHNINFSKDCISDAKGLLLPQYFTTARG